MILGNLLNGSLRFQRYLRIVTSYWLNFFMQLSYRIIGVEF